MEVSTKSEFSDLSKKLIKNFNSDIIKKNGIYFTPQQIILKMVDSLNNYKDNINNILEPSCGSCEFIDILNNEFSNINITGLELNNDIYGEINKLTYENNNINLLNNNFLTWSNDDKYDLIIGNPPFYVLPKNDVEVKYYKYFDGRPNIFIIFILKSLELLDNNGILAFVLPINFLNSIYYEKTRREIYSKYKIIELFDSSTFNFKNTQQDTMVLIIQKLDNNQLIDSIELNKNYVIEKNGFTIFNTKENIIKMKNLYENSSSLVLLNFKINIGPVVWNQCKDILTDDEQYTHLIYSSDIENKLLNIKKYKDNSKKNYIKKDGIKKMVLALNRGYGTGKYNFNYTLIDIEKEFLLENHVICIEYDDDLSKDDLKEKYNVIMKSFDNEKTEEFIKLYSGNNALNITELKYILPIYMHF